MACPTASPMACPMASPMASPIACPTALTLALLILCAEAEGFASCHAPTLQTKVFKYR